MLYNMCHMLCYITCVMLSYMLCYITCVMLCYMLCYITCFKLCYITFNKLFQLAVFFRINA